MNENWTKVKVNYTGSGPCKIEVKTLPEFFIIVSSNDIILAGEISILLSLKINGEERRVVAGSDQLSDNLFERARYLSGLKIDCFLFEFNEGLPIGRKKYHSRNKIGGGKCNEKIVDLWRKF